MYNSVIDLMVMGVFLLGIVGLMAWMRPKLTGATKCANRREVEAWQKLRRAQHGIRN